MNTQAFSRTGARVSALTLASAALLGTSALLAQTTGNTATFKPEVLQRFSGSAGNAIGARPYTPPVVSRDGRALLGTTLGGGPSYSAYSHDQSTAYRLVLADKTYSAQVLDVDYGHQFTSSVLDSTGTLWAGGLQATSNANNGAFFSLTADGQPALAAAPDSAQIAITAFSPKGQAAIDGQNNVYFSSGTQAASCTTANANTANTLWRRTAAGAIERVVRFCDFLEQAGVDSRNNPIYRHAKGGLPVALVWSETDQALYGLTQVSAAGVDPSLPATDNDGKSVGTLFRIGKAALDAGITATDGDKIDVLHTFAQNRDGAPAVAVGIISADSRASGMVEDGEWLYGTTYSGSTAASGTVWRVHKGTPGSFTVVHHFRADTSLDNTAQADGSNPLGPLVRGADGHIYGTTARDARSLNGTVATGAGTVFRIRVGTAADRSDDGYELLHHFDIETEGGRPVGLSAGPVAGGVQKLYGANRFGGATGNVAGNAASTSTGNGTLFALELPLPAVSFNTPLSASTASARVGDSLRLSWSAEHATTCTAGGSNGNTWSGTQAASGDQVAITGVLNLVGTNTFTLSCDSAYGGPAVEQSVSVSVAAASTTPTTPDTPDTGGDSGGGPLAWLLLPLAALALRRRALAH